MENIEELEKKLNAIEKACHNVWEEFMDMSIKDIPYDVAYKWYSSQPVIKEKELIQDKIRLLKRQMNLNLLRRMIMFIQLNNLKEYVKVVVLLTMMDLVYMHIKIKNLILFLIGLQIALKKLEKPINVSD